MTRRMVEITFSNALRQAAKLEECAEEMNSLARNTIPDINGDISYAWQGTSASMYLGKLEITATNIGTTAVRLQEIANAIRYAANRFRNAELRAIELAEQREY